MNKDINVSLLWEYVKNLSTGKRVRGDIYIHCDVLKRQNREILGFISKNATIDNIKWNLSKFSPSNNSYSLLYYPNFREDPHPALYLSTRFNLSHKVKPKQFNYSNSKNKPILHRKELFLDKTDPDYIKFASLTESEQQAGLLININKALHEKSWYERLDRANLRISNHKLFEVSKTK